MRMLDVGIGKINCLSFDPDGALLAAAGERGMGLGPWPALAVGRGPFTIRESQDKLIQVAWHPAGRVFAVAGLDTFVQLWDRRLRIRREFGEIGGQQGPMLTVAYSPSGRKLAFGGGWWQQPGCALIIDTRSGFCSRELEAHGNEVGAIAFLNDNVLVTGSCDKTVIVHSLSRRGPPIAAESLPSPVQALHFQPNGDRLAVAAGNTIHLWPIEADATWRTAGRTRCRGHKHEVKAISFAPDGRRLASVGKDGTLRFWDSESGAECACFDIGLAELRAIAFAPDGLTAVVGGDAGTIAIVDVDP